MPGTVHLIDDKRLGVIGAVGIPPAGAAVARRAARQRDDLAENGPGGEGCHAGNLDGGMPGTVHLIDDKRLAKRRAAQVRPAGAAVAGRGAGHRAELHVVAQVEAAVPGTSMALCQVPFTSLTAISCA